MAMQTLLTTLRACYGENQNTNPIFIEALKDNLPSGISATQAKTLAQRIVATHKFAPSIAEILEEWRQMRRDMNRHVYTAPVFTGKISPELVQFARQFFPENQ